MKRLLVALVLAGSLSGCVTVALDPEDRKRVDKFLTEIERFNNSVDSVKKMLSPEPPSGKVSVPMSKRSDE